MDGRPILSILTQAKLNIIKMEGLCTKGTTTGVAHNLELLLEEF
jgi:hypothetical protein